MKKVTTNNLLVGSFHEHPQDNYVEIVIVKQGYDLFVRLKNGELVKLYYSDTSLEDS